MNIYGMPQNKTIINPLRELSVSGRNHFIIIKSHINNIIISGVNNKIEIQAHINKIVISGMANIINGLNENCIIDEITINGGDNDINLNQNCFQVKKTINWGRNRFRINGIDVNNSPNINANVNINNMIMGYNPNYYYGNIMNNNIYNLNNNIIICII